MKLFYVCSGDPDSPSVETRRTERGVAEGDAQILRWLGKKAWVDETTSKGFK